MNKKLLYFFVILLLTACGIGYHYYTKIFKPNVVMGTPEAFIYIHTGSNFNDVIKNLDSLDYLRDLESFIWVAEKMNYPHKVIAGKYKVLNGMNSRELVQLLRSGKQTPVKLIFNNIRTKNDLALRIAEQLEADSLELYSMLTDTQAIGKLGFSKENILCMFIPNTYEVYWNTTAQKFFKRMNREYENFWNEVRKEKAKAIGLKPVQVSVLASIVESETKQNTEKPVVAGVYMNRLQQNWKLEADPTLIYALNDFTIKRVLNEHKEVVSPYNTYKIYGLPPGPICLPEISSLEAVLNFTKHDYMYFCAREDLSGFHAFAKDYSTHLANAKRYQAELNRRNIKK